MSKEDKKNQTKKRKRGILPWLKTIFWTIFVISLFRWLVLDSYTVTDQLMEQELLSGDFVGVSKLHYGPRSPSTWLKLPLTGAHFWFTSLPSYVDLPRLRLPIFRMGSAPIQNGDLVVFNHPEDWEHPLDLRKKTLSRCMGIPGDKIEIKKGQVLLNNQVVEDPPSVKRPYVLACKFKINRDFLKSIQLGKYRLQKKARYWRYEVFATKSQIKALSKLKRVGLIAKIISQPIKATFREDHIFLQDDSSNLNRDHLAPLQIPYRGLKLKMTPENIRKYGKIIRAHHEYFKQDRVEIQSNALIINGERIASYTFQENYYFVLSDNRYQGSDSRHWGFLSEDHIIGKASFVWMSISPKGTVRWNRLGFVH